MTNYFIYIEKILIIFLLSFVIGNLLLKVITFQAQKIYTKIFFAVLTGILVLTIGQAIIATKFNTILLIVPILLGVGCYIDRKQMHGGMLECQGNPIQIQSSAKLAVSVELLLLAIVLYSIQYFMLFQGGDTFAIREASQDMSCYARMADYIRYTGIEEYNSDYLFPMSNKPYHYADIWFNSVISNMSGNNTLLSLIFTEKVIYLVLIYIGLLAVLENKYQINYKIKIVCALTVFFTPLYIAAYQNIRIISDMGIFSQTFYQAQKLFFIQVLVIAAILLNSISLNKLAVAVLLCIPVLYTVTIVPVFAGFALYLVFECIRTKRIVYDELSIGIISALYILVYYFVLNPSGRDVGAVEINISDVINFKYTINIIVGTVLKHVILYFPIGVLFIVYKRSIKSRINVFSALKQSPIYVFIASMPFFGLLLWSITSGTSNSVQLFQNIAIPIFYMGSILILLVSFIELSLKFKIFIFSFLLLNAVYQIKSSLEPSPSHSSAFIWQIERKNILPNNIYATYKTNSWYRSIFSYYERGNNFGNYFVYLKNNTQPVSLDIIEHPIVGDENHVKMANQALKTSTLFRYIEGQKRIGINKNNAEYQSDFIKKNNIKILVTLKSVKLPGHLEKLVVNRIEDEVSGEVVCILSEP